MTLPPRDIEGACAALTARFGNRLDRSLGSRRTHTHTVTYLAAELPDAVLKVESAEEVAEAVAICARHRMPVIAFGAGSSLEGHLNAPQGGLSIDLSGMDQVVSVSAEDMTVTVQPGITREALNSYLRDTGLFFPIDPGANASIGGMASTRASGTTAVRYGTMKDNVLTAQAVMADGRIIRTAQRAKKTSAGYDLTRLLVGAEGTLGILTEITLKLYPIPEVIGSGTCTFASVADACTTVIETIQSAVPIARVELLDEAQVAACNAYSKLGLPVVPTLFVEFHGSPAEVQAQTETFAAIAEGNGAQGFAWSPDPAQRGKLWQARHDAYWAAAAAAPDKQVFSTDVCVPISRLADCVVETQKDLQDHGLTGPILGHVGDGNFHVLLTLDPNSAREVAEVEAFTSRLVARAIGMGGTSTGEHGVGQRKAAYLRKELGDAVDFMAAIKQALDPLNIMNPGKHGFA
ncbi:MAG: FAD-binding protein [Rhodobacterales bacterium]|nr:FAD-binding protein [Rhodobacterales bacterium]MDX5501695.1 FAD-binding protein [Rhodobacterales bacterium]